jgi:hypothetical protein
MANLSKVGRLILLSGGLKREWLLVRFYRGKRSKEIPF